MAYSSLLPSYSSFLTCLPSKAMTACSLAGMLFMSFLHSSLSVLTSLHTLIITLSNSALFSGFSLTIYGPKICHLDCLFIMRNPDFESRTRFQNIGSHMDGDWVILPDSHCPHSLLTAGTAYLTTYHPNGVWFGHILIPNLFVCVCFNGIEIRLDTL